MSLMCMYIVISAVIDSCGRHVDFESEEIWVSYEDFGSNANDNDFYQAIFITTIEHSCKTWIMYEFTIMGDLKDKKILQPLYLHIRLAFVVWGIDAISILNLLIWWPNINSMPNEQLIAELQFEIWLNDTSPWNSPSNRYSGTNMTFVLIFIKE